jgi:hypothetical protein
MTMTMTDTDLTELAKNDCFNREIDETGEWLRSPEMIDEFVLTLKLLAADLGSQLCDYNDRIEIGAREHNHEWRIRTRRLKRAVDRRLQEVVAKQKAMHRAQYETANETVWTQVKTLRDAITAHKTALMAQAYDPTDHDIALWAVLEQSWEA